MRTFLVVLSMGVVLSGCTTLQHVMLPGAPKSSLEQTLRWQAVEESSAKIALISNTAQELEDRIRSREDELVRHGGYRRSATIVRKEIEDLSQRMGMLGAVETSLKKIKQSKVFIDINCDPERRYIYRYLIEKNLNAKCIKVTDNEKEADYRLQVVIKQDGVDRETRGFLFFFWGDTLKATSSMNVSMVDRRKNIIVYEDTVEGTACHENSYVLGIGPLSSASCITSK